MITIEKLMSLEKQQVEDEVRILSGDDLAGNGGCNEN